MDKQKIFTNASYEYMHEVMDLNELAKFYNMNSKELIKGYDIILQLCLMHMVKLDDKITDVEVEFLSLIVKDNDLMEMLSKELGREINWNMLNKIEMYNGFLISVEKIFTPAITKFILSFTSLDNKTTDDYLNRLKGNVYYICQAILEIDGFDPKEKAAFNYLNDTIFKKLDDIKIKVTQ